MKKHFISFMAFDFKLRWWNKNNIEEISLKELSKDASFNFSKEKYCIGYNTDRGMMPCPQKIQGKKQCSSCAIRDISRVYTRLSYSGFESFYENFKNQEFSIYLASFADLIKCGVTRSDRLTNRAIEQGADYFIEVARIKSAELAYSMERAIQQHFDVKKSVSSAQKLKLIHKNKDSSNLLNCLSKIKQSGLIEGYEGRMKIHELNYTVPKYFSEVENINGEIYSNKGQIVFFRNQGQDYGINLSKKIATLF